jgi:hypothetical protein
VCIKVPAKLSLLYGCPGVLGINGQPLQLKLFPPVPSGGAAEVRDILEKHNLHSTSELEESNNWLVLGEDVLHGSPWQLLCKGGGELPDADCVTPIMYKKHPESHEVSFKLFPSVPYGGAAEFRDILEKPNFHGVCEPEETTLLSSFGEDVLLHGSPFQVLCEDGSELPDTLCVTPIVHIQNHRRFHSW